jgi:hypothetical protein
MRHTIEAFLLEGLYYHHDWNFFNYATFISLGNLQPFTPGKQGKRWKRPPSYYKHIPQRAFAPVDHATPRRLNWAKKHYYAK